MTIYQTILDQIKTYQTIIIHRHQKPDPDAIGSQVGLAEILRHNFPDKRVLTTGQDEPTLTFLATMDQVADGDYDGALVIVTDTANRARIDDDRYDRGAYLIKFDHHPNDEPYGDICHVDTTASSCSEMVADWAFELGLDLPLSTVRLLFAGLVGDTGRFLHPNTTAKTFAIASRLKTYDLDLAVISRQLDSFPPKIARLMGYILEHLVVDHSGAAKVVLSQETLTSYDIRTEEVSLLVGLPGKINTVNRWLIATEHADGRYRINLRSKELVINDIARRHEGGGHPLASGAWAHSLADIETIYAELQELCQNT